MKKTPKTKKENKQNEMYNTVNASSTSPSVAEKDGQTASTSSTPTESQLDPTALSKADTIPYQNLSAAVLASMPAYLKDPQYYGKINKLLYDAFLGSCAGHSDIAEWGTCVKCQRAFSERGHLMKKLGFDTPAHYLLWKRTHEIMRKELRIPYPKYNKD